MAGTDSLLAGQKIARRTLLRGAGAALALPLLEAMLPQPVRAAQTVAGKTPKRLAFLFVPNGINMKEWTPQTEGADFVLPSVLEPLASVRDSILVLSGLTQHNAFALGDGGGDHARSAAAWLTGCHPHKTSGADIKVGISADQIAALYMGRETRFPSLELGVERSGLSGDCDSGYSCAYSSAIAWRTESTPVAKETNPNAVFERLFGSVDGGNGATENPALAAQRRQDDASILDAVKDEAGSLERQLGAHDREKLDEYFTSVREIEQRVQRTQQSALPASELTALSAKYEDHQPADMGDHIRLMGDLMILAFQTDQTRVATFMLANEGSNRSYNQIGISEGHHELSHHDGSPIKLEKVRQINRYHTTQLAYILDRMQATQEANGSLLDNTLLVYGGGISDGNRHNHDDLPILVAGGKGIVRTGRHIRYAHNTPMTNLFMTVFDRMGLPTERIGSIGDSTGRLAQLF